MQLFLHLNKFPLDYYWSLLLHHLQNEPLRVSSTCKFGSTANTWSDLSGFLPFSIVFGYYSRSQTDIDGYPTVLDTSDLAYVQFHVRDAQSKFVLQIKRSSTSLHGLSSGHQHFLAPLNAFQPESTDNRPRITSISRDAGKSSLVIRNANTGNILLRSSPPAHGLMDYNADRRSERESSTAFSLESTFEKELNFTEILSKPPDDAYRMMLEYPNACWGLGTVDEIFGVKGRVHTCYMHCRLRHCT